MENHLSKESSLYLKQHANNPVEWWPWCEEAFEAAKKDGKLIIVSIGYSSCHWCHVMAHESFEDEYIAGLMNRNFICIKVDREERPDIDQMFVEVVQMITGRAGWPLNVFCLPDGKPFFGGTYFPPKDIGQGIIPWPQLLMRILEHYKKAPKELEENAQNIIHNLRNTNNPVAEEPIKMDLLEGAKMICKTHDDEWGGFGKAPKFPSPTVLDFLFSLRQTKTCENDLELKKTLDKVLITTLKGMAHGGIFDQLGGGFSRYSVDRFWAIPHFEKMLYDNGLLLSIYTKGYLLTGLELFRSIIEETIAWVVTEMISTDGVYSASLDADTEGVEGKYYAWTQEEVIKTLGQEQGGEFCEAYNITKDGNFEDGTSIPVWVYDNDQKRKEFSSSRRKLLQMREKRKRPGKDSKILVAWNSLLIKGLVDAGFYLGKVEWIELAKRACDWIWENMFDEQKQLNSVYYDGGKKIPGYLDDYAFYAESCLALASKIDCVQAGLSTEYIKRAQILVDQILKQFEDAKDAGFFFTAQTQEALMARKKYWWDQAIPSGNASLVHCFAALYILTGESRYVEQLEKLRKTFKLFAKNAPNGVSYALSGFAEYDSGIIVLKVGKGNVRELKTIEKFLSERIYSKIFILIDKKLKDDEYQLCVGTQCFALTNSLTQVFEKIKTMHE